MNLDRITTSPVLRQGVIDLLDRKYRAERRRWRVHGRPRRRLSHGVGPQRSRRVYLEALAREYDVDETTHAASRSPKGPAGSRSTPRGTPSWSPSEP
jgi:hypothetical protein